MKGGEYVFQWRTNENSNASSSLRTHGCISEIREICVEKLFGKDSTRSIIDLGE